MELTASEKIKINVSKGSSTHQTVSQILDEKANYGFMHVFQGHFTKMTEEVTKNIRVFSDSSKWPARMRTCKEVLDATRCKVEIDLLLDVLGNLKALKDKLTATNANITRNRKKLKKLDNREDGTDYPDQETHQVIEKIKKLEEVAYILKAKQQTLAKNSSAGLAYKTCCC